MASPLWRSAVIPGAASQRWPEPGLARFAGLPAPWQLPDVDVGRKRIAELASLRFFDDATSVLLIGPPGVGNATPAVPWPDGIREPRGIGRYRK